MVLPRLTVLDERYAIGRALDASEPLVFAYQAWNLHTEDQVILEEFFPAPLVHRAGEGLDVEAADAAHDDLFRYGRNQFLKETAVLAAVKHPNLVDVVNSFEAHNTAYRVLAYHKGATLASVLAKQGGKLPLKTALSIFLPLLDALQAAHQRGLIHGALSPAAVFLAKGRGPMLQGFRTTHVMMAQRTGDRRHVIVDGMAPPEQYEPEGRQGPWTDIYGAAATLFQTLTGRALPPAPRRREEDEVPALLEQAASLLGAARHPIEKALSLDSTRRPRSAQRFQQHLLEAGKKSARTRAQAPAAGPARPVASEKDDAAPEKATPVEAPAVTTRPTEAPTVKATPVEAPVAKATPIAENALQTARTGVVDPETPPVASPPRVEPEHQPSPPARPSDAGEEQADRAAQETAAQAAQKQAAKKQAAQKLVVEKLTARKQATDEKAEPKRRARPEKKRPGDNRTAVGPRRRGLPVLAALAVVVLVALSGAYVLMQGESTELSQFAHYKAQGDSLFAVANYMEAKTQYEYALATAPNNEYVAGRLGETQQRLIEVQDTRYTEKLAEGDILFATADSLLQLGDALAALSFFAEANKAYYEALRYRPDDALVLEKGQRTHAKMEEALSRNQQQTGEAPEDGEQSRAIRQQLYNSYRKQGDQLFARGDYTGARQKYLLAQEELPNTVYVTAKIQEIDERLAVTGQEARFAQLLQEGMALLDQESYAEAQITLRQALDIKPDDQQALDALNRAGSRLDTRKRDEHFQQFRDQADALFRQDRHADALARYEQALAAKPGDAYVQQKIQDLQRFLGQEPATQEPAPASSTPEDGIYTVVDEAPELVGGLKALHNKVVYPERAYQAGTEGRVYVQFVVTEGGHVEQARVIRGIGDGCDEEAVRVVQEARFIPGKVDGKPVRVRHTLFVTFKK